MQRLQTFKPQDIAVCSIVKAELFYGSQRSINPTKALEKQQQFLAPFISLPFDDLTLVTHNVREFSRVSDLKIEDWEIP